MAMQGVVTWGQQGDEGVKEGFLEEAEGVKLEGCA